MSKQKNKITSNTIAVNKKATHDYFIEQRLEAGLALQGWEVKSLRAGRAQLTESHVILRKGEVWLVGALISPLPTVSTHFVPDSRRTRKLLLHRKEINKLIGHVERKGYTIVALKLYWKNGRSKVEIGLAKGKKQHDKRAAEKDRDWARTKERALKNH
jgi:SsrA-binding protein